MDEEEILNQFKTELDAALTRVTGEAMDKHEKLHKGGVPLDVFMKMCHIASYVLVEQAIKSSILVAALTGDSKVPLSLAEAMVKDVKFQMEGFGDLQGKLLEEVYKVTTTITPETPETRH